jgi:hypothetical protein
VIAGIVAPIAASFIRRLYARYLYAAPLACLLIAWFAIQHGFSQVFSAAGIAADVAGFKMSPAYGTFIVAIASLVVAARLRKSPVTEIFGSDPQPATARAPFLVDRFCTNCGRPVSPGTNLCAECQDRRRSAASA